MAYQERENRLLWVFVGLALLFQPFEKIALGRALWNGVDIAVAVFLGWYRNLWRMRNLYEQYCNSELILQPLVAEIPWTHNILILEKCKDEHERFISNFSPNSKLVKCRDSNTVY